MNFYGLWISSTNQEYINECIKTGIWRKESYPNEENKELERKKIRELEVGSKVFLYYDAGTVAIRETKFSNYLSTNIFDHSKTIVKVKCPAIGVVKSKNEDDVSLEIEWDESYIATEWYVYFRQDGIWVFNNAQKEALRGELYEIVFNHKALDFKWWSENLDWSRKKLMILNIEEAFREWLKDKVESLAPLSSYPIALKKYIPEELKNLNEEKYTNLFECTDIEYLKSVRNRLLKNGDLHSFNTETQSRVPSAALSKYIEFLEEKNTNPQADKEIRANNAQPLNQIFYGPPGTGKTYHTIDKALKIIDGKVPESRAEAKERFETLKEAGQIEFVTFHQSYGYEEFVEGIKAKTSEKGIEYDIESGVFKRLTEEALSKDEIDTTISPLSGDETIWKMSLGDSSNGEDKVYYEEAKNTDSIIMGYGNNIDFTNCKNRDDVAKLTSDDSIIRAIDKFKNQLKNNDIVIISDGNRKFKAIVKVISDYFFDNESDLKQKRKIEWLQRFEKSRDVKEISDKDFTQATLNKPQCISDQKLSDFLTNKEIVDNTKKNHLLIIDEINRGNISKIFGELITLIEESKRLGNDEAMEVTLPYSGEKFGVPKNLYIIGTMNTADRSIALMDTALRRRFEFTEMMPQPELLGFVNNIDLAQLLVSINKRIEYLYDRDHTIGHAYFMGVEDKATLDSVMRNKVIPLLQEYFYDDWEKIQIVLGDHKDQGKEEHDKFVCSVQNNEKDILGFNYDELDEAEYSYSISETFTDEAYLKIYA